LAHRDAVRTGDERAAAPLSSARRAGIARAYLGRKPSYTREQLDTARAMLNNRGLGIAQIAKDLGLTRQTVYRIKDDPAGAEAALRAWRQ